MEGFLQLLYQLHGPGTVRGKVDFGIGIPEAVQPEGGEAALAVDFGELGAGPEGVLPEDLEAGGHIQARQTVAGIEAAFAQLIHGVAEVHLGNGIEVCKGTGCNVGHAAGKDYLLNLICVGKPGGVLGKILHGAAAGDGEGVSCKGPGEISDGSRGKVTFIFRGGCRNCQGQHQAQGDENGKNLFHNGSFRKVR